MLFNSFHFAVFFPTVLVLFFLCRPKDQWKILLAASYYFYMAWKPAYALLIAASTVVDFFAARYIDSSKTKSKKLVFVSLSLVFNLGLLAFFKYYNFFAINLNDILPNGPQGFQLPFSDFLLPVGISFYTFQTLSYTVDVYRGQQKPEPNFFRFALYVCYFPQLVAGPIERPAHLLPQLRKEIQFDYERVVSGLREMGWGFFKKVAIADRLAPMVDTIYLDPTQHKGPTLAVATLFFTFQIYCDFSGYSSIAIGAAKIMGIDLMENFRQPYFSKSISEFWQRWHISLSTWFRDYVYIPLGGNRTKKTRAYINIMIVFVVSGLWHGANWTFMLWGLFHGVFICLEKLSQGLRDQIKGKLGIRDHSLIYGFLCTGFVFGLAAYAWIFFRAQNVEESLYIAKNVFLGWDRLISFTALKEQLFQPFQVQRDSFLTTFALIIGLVMMQFFQIKFNLRECFNRFHPVLRWSSYYVLLLVIILLGSFKDTDFIYFQF